MAHTTTYSAGNTQTNLPAIVQQLVGRARARLEIRRQRAVLCWELNQYTDRDLADMGLSRADIDGIVARSHGG